MNRLLRARRSPEPVAPGAGGFGDNLTWLHDKNVFPDAGVDLVYLDPPFNSNTKSNENLQLTELILFTKPE